MRAATINGLVEDVLRRLETLTHAAITVRDGLSLLCVPSIGFAVTDGRYDALPLLAAADTAMYASKRTKQAAQPHQSPASHLT